MCKLQAKVRRIITNILRTTQVPTAAYVECVIRIPRRKTLRVLCEKKIRHEHLYSDEAILMCFKPSNKMDVIVILLDVYVVA